MPLFVYLGTDGPRAPELRPEHRPAHLAHLESHLAAGRIRFAGPLLDAAGEPHGSLILLEADDLDAARAIAEADPYLVHGIFQRIDVYATRQVLPPDPAPE